MANSTQSPVAEFYRDRSVFVTGATGFMGKVLVEKLLRCCPGVKTVYILIRPKKGKDVRRRMEQLLEIQLFDKLRREQPDAVSKLIPVCGDITLPALGLSAADTKLLVDNVSVVFHSAATVKFDEPLKVSVDMNVLGTRKIVELCHKMKSLVALVHVSTAYCNCDRSDIEEIVYQPQVHPNDLIESLKWMDEDMVRTLTPQLLKLRPNTYTYTKAMAEYLLVEECGTLPVSIVRPSIVTAAWKEPLPGWIDNLNGPTGLLIGVGKGIVRSLYCYPDAVADLIPVDIPINLMLVVGWHTATHRSDHIPVYNCTTGGLNKLTWNDIHRYCYPGLMEHPMNNVVRVPSAHFRSNRLLHFIDNIWLHAIPAYIIDFISHLAGKPANLVIMQSKMNRAMSSLEYFTTHQWNFSNDNVRKLWDNLDQRDKNVFYFDVRQIPWAKYLNDYCFGCKVFLLKESKESIVTAKKHQKKLLILSYVFTLIKFLFVWRILMFFSVRARRVWFHFLSYALRLFQILSSYFYSNLSFS